jgi:hypothetical protein
MLGIDSLLPKREQTFQPLDQPGHVGIACSSHLAHNGLRLIHFILLRQGASMSQASLEKRVAHLEDQVNRLLNQSAANGQTSDQPGFDDWKNTVGMFDGDRVMKEIIDETLKVREEDRKRTRP